MDFSNQFPVLKNYTYLNTANAGLLSNSLFAWRKAHDHDFLLTGSLFRLKRDEFMDAGRTTVARFFNSVSTYTYFVPNFSYGFNVFLAGLGASKRFLLLEGDYPSIYHPVVGRGYQFAYAQISENLEQNILETIERFNPDVLVLSLVQYSNGLKIDFDFLKQLKFKYPQLLIVADGTQFCGTASFDFDKSGIDVLVSSGYKWMLGGYGNGFVLLKEKVAEKLYTNEKNYSLTSEGPFKNQNRLSSHFEPGHLDTLNFGSLFNSVTYLQAQGIENIESKIYDLTLKAKQAFIDRDLLSSEVKNRKIHSSIFKLALPFEKIKQLEDNGIVFTSRGAGARVSFHFYNSESDLEKLLEVIDR